MLRHSLVNVDNTKKVKQFGLPRTGTNYVRFLIENNYDATVLVDKEGWKHGYISPQLPENRKCVIIIKNPYSWIHSAFDYYKEPHQDRIKVHTKSLHDFTTREFVLGHLGILLSFKNPVECWNVMNRHWLSIPYTGRKIFIVKHEELLINAERVMDGLIQTFNLKRLTSSFKNTDRTFKPRGDTPLKKDEKFRSGYYENKRYMNSFSKETTDFIGSKLDDTLMETLNYKKEI